MSNSGLAPIGVSMGEPSGIGPDIILQAYHQRAAHNLPPFVVFGDSEFLTERARRLGIAVTVAVTELSDAADAFETALPVVQIGSAVDQPGTLSAGNAKITIGAIEAAVAACLDGTARGLVTAPINKSALYDAGFAHPGHTEFLAALCSNGADVVHPVMMLAAGKLRAIPLTVHIPFADVPGNITKELIVETVKIASADLRRRLGIAQPRIGITGLNPHAGENGALGREELEVISPAITQLEAAGMDVTGPLPADTVFHPPHWGAYDVVIAMYHDQALIPVKAIGFDEGVNVTLGLPIVRTSPDHGTALDLAGTGRATANSMIAAIRLADEMSQSL